MMLRLRLGLGVGVKSDVLTFLISNAGGAFVRELTSQYGMALELASTLAEWMREET